MGKLRRVLPALLVIGVVAASGCVYWRLLKFKNQFADFHENFEFLSGARYSLIIKNPVLSGGDVDFAMKAAPSRADSLDGFCTGRVYDFVREEGSGPGGLLRYELRFSEDRFTEMRFPPEFSGLFPGDGLRALIASLGEAEVDRGERSLTARTREERIREVMPDRRRVVEILGSPTARWTGKDGRERIFYRYVLETPDSDGKPDRRKAFGRFHFEGEALRRVDASFAGHVFTFDIP